MNPIVSSFLIVILVAIGSPTHAEDIGCGEYVYLEGDEILIEPTNQDDTTNIQCAFDSAVRDGVKVVSLRSGDFLTSNDIEVANFFGTFQGVSKAATRVRVSGRNITFRAGQQTIRYMTLEGENSTNADILEFTTSEDCENLTVRPTIDRVDFRASDEEADLAKNAVAIRINPHYSCSGDLDKILGTFTVNRSTFKGALRAFEAYRIGGGAKIFITDNEIDTNFGIVIYPKTASIFVTGNQINVRHETAGVLYVLGGDYELKDVSLYLSGNRLSKSYDLPKLREGQSYKRYGFVALGKNRAPYPDDQYSFKATISGNTFLIDEPKLGDRPPPGGSTSGYADVEIEYIDDGFIGGNRFVGCDYQVGAGVVAFSGNSADGWSINSNNFPCTSSGTSYSIRWEGDNNLIGSHDAYIQLYGEGNINANDE